MKKLSPSHYFDLSQTLYGKRLQQFEKVWEIVAALADIVDDEINPSIQGEISPTAEIGEKIQIGEGTRVLPGTIILGPAIIGRNCTIGPNAYVRQNVIVGDGAVVGHVCEIKNALLMEGALVPHFAYVGDSIMGVKSHLGAGVKLSNVRIDGKSVCVKLDGERIDTGLAKFGAILGDKVEIGCNAVLNPGTLIGPESLVSGGMLVGGYFAPKSFVTHGHAAETQQKR